MVKNGGSCGSSEILYRAPALWGHSGPTSIPSQFSRLTNSLRAEDEVDLTELAG